MRLKIKTFFKVSKWNKRFLLSDTVLDWTQAILTNQGLDRVGDSYWIDGIHFGTGTKAFTESSTGLNAPIKYTKELTRDESDMFLEGESINWFREFDVKLTKSELGGSAVSELSMSWDEDNRTSTALLATGSKFSLTDDEELVVSCRTVITELLSDIERGTVDFGASMHSYVLKPCFSGRFKNSYIGTPLVQKDGRVYSGSIPEDVSVEPLGSIDTNLGTFNTYTFDTWGRTFSNFFTLSSPNAVTRTVTTHTIGLPSAFGIEFDPPIDKDFNRELTLNFKINWDRG